MAPWTIRRWMLVIAATALILGGFARPGGKSHVCGRRCQCASNLRNVVLGVLAYANEHGHFPAGTWPNAALPPEERLSWYAATLPFLESQEMWNELDRDRAWHDPANRKVADAVIGLLRCPARGGAAPFPFPPLPTEYIGIAGLGADAPLLPKGHPRAGVFGYDRRTTLADLADGAAHTMAIAESGRVSGPWLAGGPATVRGLDPSDPPYLGPGGQFGGLHATSCAMVAFADGSVRFIPHSIDPRIFEALSTISGREALPPDLGLESLRR